jgi:YD repeat-containing protein
VLATRDPRGHITTFAYDNAGQQSSFTDAQGRNNSNVMTWSSAGKQLFNRSYAYDELNRLASVTASGQGVRGANVDLRHLGQPHQPVPNFRTRPHPVSDQTSPTHRS